MMNEYIRQSSKKNTEKLLFNRIVVFIKDPLPQDVDIDEVIFAVERRVPGHLVHSVDMIYVGEFEEIKERELDALYADGAIYLTNNQTSEEDMIDDIVHEMAHACEETYSALIYPDNEIQSEFFGKRKRLYETLKAEGYDVSVEDFLNIDYSDKLDMFFYKDVGYDRMTIFTLGLFVSPYGATSYREYFANAFEHYFLEDPQYVKVVSPAVYHKISGLINMDI